MKTIFEERDEARAALEAAIKKLEETGDGVDDVQTKTAALKELDAKCARAQTATDTIRALGKTSKTVTTDSPAPTLGDHFIKHVAAKAVEMKQSRQMAIVAPEYKAQTDVHKVLTEPAHLAPVQVDTNFVRPYNYPLTIADWLGSGAMTERTLVYFVEKAAGAVEGAFTTVEEGAKKPQLHFGGYEQVTETLRKIAGYIKISTEMLEDQEYLVTELNNRLLIELKKFEEAQLLNGNGSGQNVQGILNRTGVQAATYTGYEDLADAVFRACTSVRVTTGLDADGIIMHPTDYQALRLSKDGNGQYYAGGPFQGVYGNGTVMQDPPLWGKRTIVTPAITQGTVLVGAGQQAATVYRKGGVTVATSFENEDDFVNNRVTVLAEERLALAVRVPAAFVKLTKAAARS